MRRRLVTTAPHLEPGLRQLVTTAPHLEPGLRQLGATALHLETTRRRLSTTALHLDKVQLQQESRAQYSEAFHQQAGRGVAHLEAAQLLPRVAQQLGSLQMLVIVVLL